MATILFETFLSDDQEWDDWNNWDKQKLENDQLMAAELFIQLNL